MRLPQWFQLISCLYLWHLTAICCKLFIFTVLVKIMFVENLQYFLLVVKHRFYAFCFWPKLTIFLEFSSKLCNGGSRICMRWRRQLSRGGQHTILPKFPQNCLKSKEFGRRGDAIGAFHRSLPTYWFEWGTAKIEPLKKVVAQAKKPVKI